MEDHGYDDGLVHGHRWASEPLGYSPRKSTVSAVTTARARTRARSEASHDEGPVHEHRRASCTPAR
ncbi:conserved protein of unknown function [Rhodovastum atsumiense]|uniref:Uncharacterized protein n=1 Tax=Rhodovastum atsumiense TaxID=504468 RepID=A0A5M6IU06_9PROT|nr:hypothetical protein [Rhodovastum atsumiense]KAA5610915.1 hypothetical protein F1189_16880 [Rhodovastum atsumiense]CAH2601518.1 conserved protein of unknown function [Rhodovastum atsumiense]